MYVGSHQISALVVNENGAPVSGATVTAKLADNLTVTEQQVTDEEGRATFSNIPDRTILFGAMDENNNIDSVGALGSSGHVRLVIRGFNEVSTVDNNDFSLGLEGWNTGDAPVTLREHQAPVFDFSRPDCSPAIVQPSNRCYQ